MAELFILLPGLDGDAPLFAWREQGGWIAADTGPSGHAGKVREAVAIAPGTAVAVHQAAIPPRKPAEALRVAQFAVEEDVAEPVEALHVALGPVGSTTRRTIHVASHADMQRWMRCLEEAGLPEADIIAAHDCLPEANMAVEGPQEILFNAGDDAFALDADAPDDLISSLAPASLDAVHGERLARLAGMTAAGPAVGSREDWLVQLAGWHEQAPERARISLRQGDYSLRQPMQLGGLSRWRPVAALAAVAAVTWISSVWLETSALQGQTESLRMRTNNLLNTAVPEAQGNLPAALTRLQQKESRSVGAVRPTIMSAALYEAVQPTANAEVRSLRYDADGGRLTATVVFDSYSEADAIGERLEKSGLSVSLGQARQSGNRVLGEFVMEAGS
ncbi:type II secretion system protein GspL [Henriciella aquimarina]|uniref:type II secretion system protein GspL n=1 Tax=Henriciella aquimarina TaxID=545261 RepID=UPI000A005E2E|nr:type II secretion system protein GspL [Henriciella aquimarina]